MHNSFLIEAEAEEGINIAQIWAKKELGMETEKNPDFVILRYGLFSVDNARSVLDVATGAPFSGEYKVIIITASRAYHEAQNALLKLFEEPPKNTYIFFILPSLGGILPTLRSRVAILSNSNVGLPMSYMPAEEFIKANKEKRSAIIKKLTSGKDEEERRELRDDAISIVNGIEAIAYKWRQRGDSLRGPQGVSSLPQFQQGVSLLLSDIAVLREYLYDRSAPVKMILEHLSLVIPKNLL